MNHVQVTSDNFEAEVLKSPIPVLVDLYADWCSPCRMLAQLLDQLAPQLAGRVKIAKINTDAEGDLAAAFNVSSIPMLVLFKDGKVVDSGVGLLSTQQILAMVDRVAKSAPVATPAAKL